MECIGFCNRNKKTRLFIDESSSTFSSSSSSFASCSPLSPTSPEYSTTSGPYSPTPVQTLDTPSKLSANYPYASSIASSNSDDLFPKTVPKNIQDSQLKSKIIFYRPNLNLSPPPSSKKPRPPSSNSKSEPPDPQVLFHPYCPPLNHTVSFLPLFLGQIRFLPPRISNP